MKPGIEFVFYSDQKSTYLRIVHNSNKTFIIISIFTNRIPAHEWFHKCNKLKQEFITKVWACTSGSVNTLEAVERYAREWIRTEDIKYKKRIKVKKWRDQISKEKEEERTKKELELKENVQDCKDCERRMKNHEKSKETKRKLAEWKEIKSMKEELERADDLVKTVHEMERNIGK